MSVNGATQALRGGEYFLPFASMTHEGASVSSKTSGRTLVILPPSTWTRMGPPPVQFTKVFSPINNPLVDTDLFQFDPTHYAVGAPMSSAISVVEKPCRNV